MDDFDGRIYGQIDGKIDSPLDGKLAAQIDAELQRDGISFSDAMRKNVIEMAGTRSEAMRKPHPTKQPAMQHTKPSFWNREIRIPVPALMIPIVLIAVFGSMLLRMPGQLGSGSSASGASQVIQLPSGVFSSEELNHKG